MRPAQLEAWTLSIVDRVLADQPLEDSRVELKDRWIDPVKAARRLAGHANAAYGDSILWIIGIDEKQGLTGATQNDLAQWLPQVYSEFESIVPTLISDIVVPVQNTFVVALLFDTSRAPYIIYNPVRNQPGCGPVEREVPWREGTRVRSARREDLIRMLVPLLPIPKIEILSGSALLQDVSNQSLIHDRSLWLWRIDFKLYVVPQNSDRVVIPVRQTTLELEFSNDTKLLFTNISFRSTSFNETRKIALFTINCTPDEALIDGPGALYLVVEHSDMELNPVVLSSVPEVAFKLTIKPLFIDKMIIVTGQLIHKKNDSEQKINRFEWIVADISEGIADSSAIAPSRGD